VHGDEAVLTFEGVLRVEGRGASRTWAAGHVELAAVQEVSGEVTELPVTCVRSGKSFRLGAEVPLSSLFGELGPGERAYVRVRFACQNVAWETRVTRPSVEQSLVEVTFLPDETMLMQRPPVSRHIAVDG
jgi:hypothetical protein